MTGRMPTVAGRDVAHPQDVESSNPRAILVATNLVLRENELEVLASDAFTVTPD